MNQREQAPTPELVKLSDTGLVVADASEDVRGRTVLDRDGTAIGHVSGLFNDPDRRKVRMLEIRTGGFLGFGERHALLPVEAVTHVSAHDVQVNETRERIATSPVYDPTLIVEPDAHAWEPYYGYYGLPPYWSGAGVYPDFAFRAEEGPEAGDRSRGL
jgi:hypothetical protein